MIINFSDPSFTEGASDTSDVCIIGAGVAGIYLAQALEKKGLVVSLIEAGGMDTTDAKLAFEPPHFAGDIYSGASLGRASGLGGTSAKWGGQMITLSPHDFDACDDKLSPLWPISYNDIVDYYNKVSDTLKFKYSVQDRFQDKIFGNQVNELKKFFSARLSTWIPFSGRNFAKQFHKVIHSSTKLKVWINAKIKEITLEDRDKKDIQSLYFYGLNDRELIVYSKVYVVCMGALESSRIILNLYNKEDTRHIIHKTAFCDHVSSEVGLMKIKNRKLFLEYFSPKFEGKFMKSLRYELSEEAQKKLNLDSAFVHFISKHPENSCLFILRSFYRKIQGEKISINLKEVNIFEILHELSIILFWRFFKRKLVLNFKGDINVVVDVEQRPTEENKIFVRDRKLVIDWRVTDREKNITQVVSNLFADLWNSSEVLKSIGRIELFNKNSERDGNYYDVYHPTGSIPFGTSREKSLLDKNLRFWNASNLYVSSTAVFPSGATANPGFTHLALTHRLSEHIIEKLR